MRHALAYQQEEASCGETYEYLSSRVPPIDAQGRTKTGNKVQRLEIRFDGVAGCLRAPNGGSSRQTVVLVDRGIVRSRLMTVRECARLMGAPDTYKLHGPYNDDYRAMGDAVVVPVTRWLTRHLLTPLGYPVQQLSLRESQLRKALRNRVANS